MYVVTGSKVLQHCAGYEPMKTTVMLKRDSSSINATLDSISANQLSGTEQERIIN
jgi:hypothetical protein